MNYQIYPKRSYIPQNRKRLITKGMARKRQRQIAFNKPLTPYNQMKNPPEIKTVDCTYYENPSVFSIPLTLANCTSQLSTAFLTAANGLTGGYIPLNGIAPGNAFNNRIGSKIMMKSIQVRANITCPSGDNMVRLVLILDRQPNGVAPVSTIIFAATTALGVGGDQLTGINTNYRKRFKILKDEYIEFTGLMHHKCINFYVKQKLPVDYIGGDSTIGSIGTNAVYLMAMSIAPVGSRAGCTNLFTRVRYYDN